MSTNTNKPFPVQQVASIESKPESSRWLVRSIWTNQAVGFIGGPPKSCKTWFGLDLAVSVASGTACLGRYPVEQRGPALVYLAEDDPADLRYRVAGLCAHRGLRMDSLDLQVVTIRGWRLDIPEHRQSLEETVKQVRPRLLLLDPLVRLHRLDENSASEISGLLGFLRELQILYSSAIALVHHMSKRSRTQLGYALRGSSDLFAWADSNVYLVSKGNQLTLSLQHRTAPASDPIHLALAPGSNGNGPHLEVVVEDQQCPSSAPLADAVLQLLARADAPLTRATLRQQLHVNNQRLGNALVDLEQRQLVRRTTDGWTNNHIAPHPAGHPQATEERRQLSIV